MHRLRFTLVLLILSVVAISVGCKKNRQTAPGNPTGSGKYYFTWSPDPIEGLPITFTSNAPAGSTYKWNFGGGYTYTDAQPVFNFGQAGTYTVSLVVNNDVANTVTRQIVVGHRIMFFFIDKSCEGDTVHFTCDSATNYYHWDFGDGDTANVRNPYHTYKKAGDYRISLKAGNQTAFSNNYVIHIYKDPLYTNKAAGTRLFHVSTHITGLYSTVYDSLFTFPDSMYTVSYIDKLTLHVPDFSITMSGGNVDYDPSASTGNTLVYSATSYSGKLTLYYDHVADTMFIQHDYDNIAGNHTGPYYRYHNVARTQ